MKLKSIITAAMALLVSTACNGTKQQQTESSTSNEMTAMAKDGKALVVFFSHAGDNYAVGNIEVGNTKIVADYITELTGAEQFECRLNSLRHRVHRWSRLVGHLSAGDVYLLQEARERPEGQDRHSLYHP